MPQLCFTITDELRSMVHEFAEGDKRTDSQMAAILIEQAIKERIRQREKAKKAKQSKED